MSTFDPKASNSEPILAGLPWITHQLGVSGDAGRALVLETRDHPHSQPLEPFQRSLYERSSYQEECSACGFMGSGLVCFGAALRGRFERFHG